MEKKSEKLTYLYINKNSMNNVINKITDAYKNNTFIKKFIVFTENNKIPGGIDINVVSKSELLKNFNKNVLTFHYLSLFFCLVPKKNIGNEILYIIEITKTINFFNEIRYFDKYNKENLFNIHKKNCYLLLSSILNKG